MSHKDTPSTENTYGLDSYAEALAAQAGVEEEVRPQLIAHLKEYLIKCVESGRKCGLTLDAAILETLFAFGPVDDARWKKPLRAAWWYHYATLPAGYLMAITLGAMIGVIALLINDWDAFIKTSLLIFLASLVFTTLPVFTSVRIRDGIILRCTAIRTVRIAFAEIDRVKILHLPIPAVLLGYKGRRVDTGLYKYGAFSVIVMMAILRPDALDETVRLFLANIKVCRTPERRFFKWLCAVLWLAVVLFALVDVVSIWQGYGAGASLMIAFFLALITTALQTTILVDPLHKAYTLVAEAFSSAGMLLAFLMLLPGIIIITAPSLVLILIILSVSGMAGIWWRGSRKPLLRFYAVAAILLLLGPACSFLGRQHSVDRFSTRWLTPVLSRFFWNDTSRFTLMDRSTIIRGEVGGVKKHFIIPSTLSEMVHCTDQGVCLYVSKTPHVATQALETLNLPADMGPEQLDLYRSYIEDKGGKVEYQHQLMAYDFNTDATSVVCELKSSVDGFLSYTQTVSPDGRYMVSLSFRRNPVTGRNTSFVFNTVTCTTSTLPLPLIKEKCVWESENVIRACYGDFIPASTDPPRSATMAWELWRIHVPSGEADLLNRIDRPEYNIEKILPGLNYAVVGLGAYHVDAKTREPVCFNAALLHLDNGKISPIPAAACGEYGDFTHSWSSTHNRLAYIAYHREDNSRSLCVVSATGGLLLNLPLHPKDSIHRMAFSPDGRKLCVQRLRNPFLWGYGMQFLLTEIVDIETGRKRLIWKNNAPFGMLLPAILSEAPFPSWSPDGSLMAIDTERFDLSTRDVLQQIEFIRTDESLKP